MTKVKELCNRLITENLVNEFDTLSFNHTNARIKTLDSGKGHPVIYRCKLAPTVLTDGAGGVCVEDTNKKLRIRRLTPKECWRLMGFDDSDFDKASKVNSDNQLYKQAGNSIVVNCLEGIFKNLLF